MKDRWQSEVSFEDADIKERMRFLELQEEDFNRLRALHPTAQAYANDVIQAFYEHLKRFPESAAFLADPEVAQRAKNAHKQYFLELTAGCYDRAYLDRRVEAGVVHERLQMPTRLYLGAYAFYLRTVAPRIFAAIPERDRAFATLMSLSKLVFFDMSLAIDVYLLERENTISKQQQAIHELSTPVLQIREGLLVLPLIGMLDQVRTRQLTQSLLSAIKGRRSTVVILDITGVPSVDMQVAQELIRVTEAAQLMGATTIISGVSSAIATALVSLGIDLSQIRTVNDLQGAVEAATML